jgi:hypothetical protein
MYERRCKSAHSKPFDAGDLCVSGGVSPHILNLLTQEIYV